MDMGPSPPFTANWTEANTITSKKYIKFLRIYRFGDVRRHDNLVNRKIVKSKTGKIIIELCISENLLKK